MISKNDVPISLMISKNDAPLSLMISKTDVPISLMISNNDAPLSLMISNNYAPVSLMISNNDVPFVQSAVYVTTHTKLPRLSEEKKIKNQPNNGRKTEIYNTVAF